jgi:hypothetical protein
MTNSEPCHGFAITMSRVVLTASFALFGAGATMIGLSLTTDQALFWQWGLAFALSGQAALVLGLAIHLVAEWTQDRTAHELLNRLNRQVWQLSNRKPSDSAASSLYTRIAEGASPHLLLADLQSQIEQLAQQLKKSR